MIINRVRLVYAREILNNTRTATGLSLIAFGIAWYYITHELKCYDYVVYGSGSLTKSLVYFLNKSGHSVLQVIPYTDSVMHTPIDGSDLCITSSVESVNTDSFFHYPRCVPQEVHELRQLTGLSLSTVQDAESRVLAESGERSPGVYYYNFDSKISEVPMLKKQGIQLVRQCQDTDVLKVYFNDLTSVRCGRLVFADTGQVEELLHYFWDQSTVLTPSVLVGMSNKVVKSSQISFLRHNNVDVTNFIDRMYFWVTVPVAVGIPNKFKCVYNNDSVSALEAAAKNYLSLGDTQYHLDPVGLGMVDLTKFFRAWNNRRVLLLNPIALKGGLHWKRNLLILFALAHEL